VLVPALACAALAGQLATVADQLLADHVTCLAHGERIHVDEAQAQCLFDDDVDVVPAAAPATLPPLRIAIALVAVTASHRPLLHEPLYRLAPKNSPPA